MALSIVSLLVFFCFIYLCICVGVYAYASTVCVEVERQSAGVSFPFTVWVLGIELTQIVRVYGKVLYPPIHLENPLYFWQLGSDVS